MSLKSPRLNDRDNPEWTRKDFARAQPAAELPPDVLEQFPATHSRLRGAQKAPRKVQIAIRLAPDIVEHFRASGPGWHGRIEAALRRAAGLVR